MPDRDVQTIVAECDRYWRSTGVPPTDVDEMAAELRSHLADAAAVGKAPADVVGPDLAAFAEEWARAYRGPVASRRPWPTASAAPASSKRLLLAIGAIVAGFIAVAILAPKEEAVDVESWRWIWIGAAVILAVGELLTAGFFLLPFAVGAGAAAVLAFLGVGPVIQLVTFVIVSVLFLVVLQRFARTDDQAPSVDAGANRYVGGTAVVIEPVDRLGSGGLVRVETEEWRATTDQSVTIPAGAEVRIVGVRGTRLVVEPIPPKI